MQTVFEDSATAAQIRDAVLSVKGSIVGGPGAMGIYTLQLPANANTEQAAALLQALDYIGEVSVEEVSVDETNGETSESAGKNNQ